MEILVQGLGAVTHDDPDPLDEALLGFSVDEGSLLYDIATRLADEGSMIVRWSGDEPMSIRLTNAGERICRLLDQKD